MPVDDMDLPGMIGDVAGIADSISDVLSCVRDASVEKPETLVVKAQAALEATKTLLHELIERL